MTGNFPSLRSYLEQHKFLLPIMEDVVKNKTVVAVPSSNNGERGIRIIVNESPYANFCEEVVKNGPSTSTDFIVGAHFMAEGPKVFQPTDEQAEAMERIRPQIPFSEYKQPFPTFAVEFPTEYRRRRRFEGAEPVVGIAHFTDKRLLLTSIVWSGGTSTTNCYRPKEEVDELLEDIICLGSDHEWDGTLPIADSERSATQGAVRLLVNVCLMMMSYGCRKLGYLNPQYGATLERRAAKKTAHTLSAKKELHSLPTVYGFEQNINFWRATSASSSEHSGPTGKTVAPHWRIGHCRMQPYGPKSSLRKLIVVPAVFINAHLFKDSQANTASYYKGQ